MFPETKLSFLLNSPGDRGTKKHIYLLYRGAILFWVYLVPLRLVSIFLNVGHVDVSCGLLPTRFFVDITIKLYCCQKRWWCFKFNFRKNNLHHQKARKKLNIRHLYGYLKIAHYMVTKKNI